MTDNIDYSLVPSRFAHCFNDKCPRSAECLRFKVTSYIPAACSYVLIVNPAHTESEEECRYFQTCVPLRYAVGMDKLLVDLPYQKAKEIKQKMKDHYGKTYFYRLMRKERRFTPEDQCYVGRLFRDSGIESEPVFDAYVESYEW